MVIQIRLGLGADVEIKTYRNVLPHHLAEYREGFYANVPNYHWGEMYSIRGKDKKLIGRF